MQEVNLGHFIQYALRKWHVIIIAALVGLGLGIIFSTSIQKPIYKSDATIILVNEDGSPSNAGETLTNNYIELLKSRRVLEPVIKSEKLKTDYDSLLKKIEATSEKKTEVIKITVSSGDATESKETVDGIISSFKKEYRTLYNLDNVKIVDEGNRPDKPSNINIPLQLAIGTFLGLVSAITALYLRYDETKYQLAHKARRDKKRQKHLQKLFTATHEKPNQTRQRNPSPLAKPTSETPPETARAREITPPQATPAQPPPADADTATAPSIDESHDEKHHASIPSLEPELPDIKLPETSDASQHAPAPHDHASSFERSLQIPTRKTTSTPDNHTHFPPKKHVYDWMK